MGLPVIDFIGMFLHALGFFSRLPTTEGLCLITPLQQGWWECGVCPSDF
jgi:hypothetical protein